MARRARAPDGAQLGTTKVREALPSCLLFQTNISEVLSDDADDANFVFFFKGAMPIQRG